MTALGNKTAYSNTYNPDVLEEVDRLVREHYNIVSADGPRIPEEED